MGAPPPIKTPPTSTCRDPLRFIAKLISVLFQNEAGDFDLDVRAQVHGLAVIGQPHEARVADHDLERRGAAPRARAAGGGGGRGQPAGRPPPPPPPRPPPPWRGAGGGSPRGGGGSPPRPP